MGSYFSYFFVFLVLVVDVVVMDRFLSGEGFVSSLGLEFRFGFGFWLFYVSFFYFDATLCKTLVLVSFSDLFIK
jgi:hypothetical protein